MPARETFADSARWPQPSPKVGPPFLPGGFKADGHAAKTGGPTNTAHPTLKPMPTVRYLATLHGHTDQVAVDVEDNGNGQLVLVLAGKRHAVDALALSHGAVSLLVDGQVYDVEFDDVGEEVQVWVRGDVFRVDVADERSLR